MKEAVGCGATVHLPPIYENPEVEEDLLHSSKKTKNDTTVELEIDYRVHGRLFGPEGKAIAKVLQQFNVVVNFPKDGKTNIVTISGIEENL